MSVDAASFNDQSFVVRYTSPPDFMNQTAPRRARSKSGRSPVPRFALGNDALFERSASGAYLNDYDFIVSCPTRRRGNASATVYADAGSLTTHYPSVTAALPDGTSRSVSTTDTLDAVLSAPTRANANNQVYTVSYAATNAEGASSTVTRTFTVLLPPQIALKTNIPAAQTRYSSIVYADVGAADVSIAGLTASQRARTRFRSRSSRRVRP